MLSSGSVRGAVLFVAGSAGHGGDDLTLLPVLDHILHPVELLPKPPLPERERNNVHDNHEPRGREAVEHVLEIATIHLDCVRHPPQ